MPTATRSTKHRSEKTKKLPAWITSHFEESLSSHELLMQIVDISSTGIGVLRGMPKLVKVLADVEGKADDPESTRRLERAEKEAELANAEVARGFPVLHGLAVVAQWSWMEHFVKGFVALWILNHRASLNTPALQKLRVRLGDYVHLQKVEQSQLLVELLEQDLGSSLKRGATRFESLLEPFGISFPLPDGCGKVLFEMQQIRNVIAHRNSRADRRLRSECPWLKLKLNQPVHVSRKMLTNYSTAQAEFLVAFLYRVGDVYGIDLRPTKPEAPNPSIEGTVKGLRPSPAPHVKR